MANRRYRSPQPKYTRGYIPEVPEDEMDYAGAMRMASPEYQAAFEYSQLEDKYPIKTLYGEMQREEQRKRENLDRQKEIEYRANIIKDRQSQLELKKAARDLDMYESQINREDAMLEQIPIARQKLAELDVRDPNFINKAYDIQDEHPMAFESEQFQKYVFQPMLNRNSRLTGRRQEGIVTDADLKEAMGEISKYNELIAARGEGVGPSPEEERYLGFRQNQIDKFYSQRGMDNPMATTAPQPTSIATQPALAPSAQQFSFSSIEEAESAGLPAGTIVYINGRKARID